MQEPIYDIERINTDDAYAFAKLKELAHYLPTIEPFTDRAEWFFKTSRIWGFEPGYMGGGKKMIPDPKTFSHITEDGKQVDKNGQRVETVAWGLNCNNEEERGILHKLYFLHFYCTRSAYFLNRPRLDFDYLLQKYSIQRQTERGKRLQLEWATGEINNRQQVINDWITANSDRYSMPEIRRQLQNAAVLIEQELEGILAIRWELFYRTFQLAPLALLWGLIEYKRFLETEEVTTPTVPALLSSEVSKQEFTVRERMLIHCYEQREVIKKGKPNYNIYITFATPAKRKGYPNGSISKAKRLISSIQKILPYLSEKAAQQANNEIDTISANI